MPHYTTQQIYAANRMDIAAFLMSHGEKLSRQGQEFLWQCYNVWIKGNQWYSHYDTILEALSYYELVRIKHTNSDSGEKKSLN